MADLDQYRDKIRLLRSATPGTRPNVAQMKPGEIFVNYADRVFAIRNEDKEELTEIAGFETGYRDLIVQNKVFLPKAGLVDEIIYNTAFKEINADDINHILNISDTSESVILLDYITSDLTINITGIEDYTNKIIKLYITKDEHVPDDLTITWNGVSTWLSDDNSAPRWGAGNTASDLIVAIFITGSIVVCNTFYNSENPVMSGSSFINWGQIKGDITNQSDLKYYLDQKIDATSAEDKYVTKIDARVTDKLTIGV